MITLVVSYLVPTLLWAEDIAVVSHVAGGEPNGVSIKWVTFLLVLTGTYTM